MPSPWPVGTKWQFFEGAHRIRVYVRVFIGVSIRTCINIYIYIVFLKKILNTNTRRMTWQGFHFYLPIKKYDIFIAGLPITIQNTHGTAFDLFRLQMPFIKL
jgi:hypothetical protein